MKINRSNARVFRAALYHFAKMPPPPPLPSVEEVKLEMTNPNLDPKTNMAAPAEA